MPNAQIDTNPTANQKSELPSVMVSPPEVGRTYTGIDVAGSSWKQLRLLGTPQGTR